VGKLTKGYMEKGETLSLEHKKGKKKESMDSRIRLAHKSLLKKGRGRPTCGNQNVEPSNRQNPTESSAERATYNNGGSKPKHKEKTRGCFEMEIPEEMRGT